MIVKKNIVFDKCKKVENRCKDCLSEKANVYFVESLFVETECLLFLKRNYKCSRLRT